ncbi:MAG: succinylglutamate desuccinylase/aspartoacylase family protein [Planctomycetota bacterium]
MPRGARRATAAKVDPCVLGGETIRPGARRQVDLPIARLPSGTWEALPVEVLHGRRPGPRIWLSGAIHGDELNGVEIIRRVTRTIRPAALRGTIVSVPIVNVFGFLTESRYLPDRRDLNRSFPGSARGSMASRLAHLFMEEIVKPCGYGIDLHTGAFHRTNLPQIRANLKDEETRRCAEAFGAPVMMHSRTRDRSLREAATRLGIHVLLYEGGQSGRFDEDAIRVGTRGVLRVLEALDMWDHVEAGEDPEPSAELYKSTWVRAGRSGLLRLQVGPGDRVEKGTVLGFVGNTFGDRQRSIRCPREGIVIGVNQHALVNRGDAVVHVGLPID